MIELVPDPAKVPTDEVVRDETAEAVERLAIRYWPLADAAWGAEWTLYPVRSPHRQEIADAIGHYFKREGHFDFRPYSSGDEGPNSPVYLIASMDVGTMVPLIAGAAGLVREATGVWLLTWTWLHPWERGGKLTKRTFDALDELHGDFHILAPVSPAMSALMAKRGYGLERLRRQE